MLGWTLLLANTAATFTMLGLIWFVQLVHYPLMTLLPEPVALLFAARHQLRTTWIVGPVMFVEAVTGLLVIFIHPPGMHPAIAVVGFLLILFIFYRTGAVHVPQHRALARDHDCSTCEELVRSNWLRTLAWTIRGGLVLLLIV